MVAVERVRSGDDLGVQSLWAVDALGRVLGWADRQGGRMASEAAAVTTHVVWLSGGKDSTAMALRLAELHPETDWQFVCTPTGNELPDVYDHWERMGDMLGQPLERVAHPLGLAGLIEAQAMLPSHAARWCTRMLKMQTAKAWYLKHAPCIAYVGLRADEPEREGFWDTKIPQRYPLREWGWGLPEVLGYLQQRGVKVPKRTDCAWCYDQSLPDWWELWHRYPAIYEQGEQYERQLKHTFRSASRDTWPAKLEDLRQRFEKGDVPRNTELNLDLFDNEPKRCRACTL